MKKSYLLLLGVAVLTFGIFGGAAAQVEGPPSAEAAQASLPGTAFTYQGQLRTARGPVNGACDMTFQLFDSGTAGNAIGSAVTKPVAVANGLFTVGLDFGGAAFNGEARWVEIRVKCTGDAALTTLTPRQSITPAPYALALPGLRTQRSVFQSTIPSLIGGVALNTVAADVVGAVIGGGGTRDNNGQNSVTDDFGVIGGGAGNTSGDGNAQRFDNPFSTVGGGEMNSASGSFSTVSGGVSNAASGGSSSIAGGGGNTASGAQSSIAGGGENTAGGIESTVAGGYRNTADAEKSTVGGGAGNTTSAVFATVPGGLLALASHYGEMAYASGSFAADGDAQTSVYVLRTTVPTGQGSGELFLDGHSTRLTIAARRTLAFDILIVARSDGGKSSAWRYQGAIEYQAGVTHFIGTPTRTTLGEDDPVWDVGLVADDANDALVIKGFSNGSGDTIRFGATVRTMEVSW